MPCNVVILWLHLKCMLVNYKQFIIVTTLLYLGHKMDRFSFQKCKYRLQIVRSNDLLAGVGEMQYHARQKIIKAMESKHLSTNSLIVSCPNFRGLVLTKITKIHRMKTGIQRQIKCLHYKFGLSFSQKCNGDELLGHSHLP